MTPQRTTAGVLSILLLGWSIARGVGDLRTQIFLAVGIVLGVIYVVYGRIPDLMLAISTGSLVADDDPDNISPRV